MSRFNPPTPGVRAMIRLFAAVVAISIATPIAAASGETPDGSPDELFDMSLEELLGGEITSVSRRSQSLSTAVAAVFVISQQDIRRTGAQSIPLAVVGKNLLESGHVEFISELGDVVPVEIERRAIVELRRSF